MQHVERHVRLELRRARLRCRANVDAGDAIALRSAASAQALPSSGTSRSADQPPIRTATCFEATIDTLSCVAAGFMPAIPTGVLQHYSQVG
jgi:hypothetical protein